MTTYEKPIPGPTIEGRTFWEYCKQHELRMQKCPQCGYVRFPASVLCPNCHSIAPAEWVQLSGRGKVYTFVVFHYVYNRAFEKEVPYVVASIELEEGPRMMSNVIGCAPDDVQIGMPVKVTFEDITDQYALPKFRPLSEGE